MESSLAFSAVLVAQYPQPPFLILAQAVRAKQPQESMVASFNGPFVRNGSPDSPIDILHRPDDPRLDNTVRPQINGCLTLFSMLSIIYNTVVLGLVIRSSGMPAQTKLLANVLGGEKPCGHS